MNIESLTIKVRSAESGMTDDERLEFWSLIMQGYCRHCGCEDPNGMCVCWNDE